MNPTAIQHAKPEATVRRYIAAYNRMDVDGMLAECHPDVVFENYQGGQLTHRTEGIEALRAQAESALPYFARRSQTVHSLTYGADGMLEAEIHFEALLAQDIPGGPAAGTELRFPGRSIFGFTEGLITAISDYA